MSKLNLFIPMVKYDAEQHIGHGVLAEEVTDKSKEIFDYETSKVHFAEWSNAFKKITDGASAGNLRAMHGNTAAGKFLDVAFDDAAKKIPVSFKVVDPVDQAKCAEGVYTGLSIGGEYVKRWPADENGVVRYTAKPVEGSLVDNPCMYGATFEYIKAAGEAPELRKFVGGEPEKSAVERGLSYLMKTLSPASLLSIIGATQKAPEVVKAEEPPAPAVAEKPADPKPVIEEDIELETAKGIRAAFSRAMAPDAGKVIGQKNLIKLRLLIVKRWKEKLDPKASSEAQKEAIDGRLVKSWSSVSTLASCLCSIQYCLESMEMCNEGDSAAFMQCEAACQAMCEAVAALAGECAMGGEAEDGGEEMAMGVVASMTKDAATAKMHLKKAITIHKGHMDGTVETDDASQAEMMTHMKEALTELGDTATKADEPKPIPAPASTDVDAVTKAFATVVKAQTEATAKDLEKRIAKTLGESVEPLKKSIEEIRDAAAKVDERLKKIEKTPAEAGSPIRVVDKTMGGGREEFAGLDLDTAMKVVDEVTKGGASPAAVNELKIALAARMMPH